ncbi:MAG: hypothetical protein GX660_28780, partial [Clostridiaceae bacterium]|nr:hypothetical protein [Clostridiaceae bacterium]
IDFDSDESGTYYCLVYESTNAAPDATTIKAQGAAVAKGTGLSVSGLNTVSVSGLTINTAYKAYFIVEDKDGHISNIGEIDLTTQPEGYTLPARIVNVPAEVTKEVKTTYTVNLSNIFEDLDGGVLTYSVSINGAAFEIINTNYSYTPMYSDNVILVFRAKDSFDYSVDTYKVTIKPITSFEGGTGTLEDPYLISTANQLSYIRYSTDKHFKLINNIDLSVYSSGAGWDPIDALYGSLDGQRYTISSLTIKRLTEDDTGLFSYIQKNGLVKNTNLINAAISAKITSGIIAGDNYGSIENCYVEGSINGDVNIGGIAGINFGIISGSIFSGTVTGTSYRVGGIVGYNLAIIIDSFASGTISGSSYVGGITGRNDRNDSPLYISNSYSLCAVFGGEYTGGLIGENNLNEVFSSYWNTETSAMTTSSGGEGKTIPEMHLRSTYVGWDFGNVWGMNSECNNGYPFLQWQGYADETVPSVSGLTINSLSQTTATIDFDSDESGTYYCLVYESTNAAPDATTIKAQGAAVAKGTGLS